YLQESVLIFRYIDHIFLVSMCVPCMSTCHGFDFTGFFPPSLSEELYITLSLSLQLYESITILTLTFYDIFCLNKNANNVGTSGDALWTQIAGKMSYYSCGPYSMSFLYLTGASCGGSGVFEAISGSLSMIEVATDGNVFGVYPQETIIIVYFRIGIIDTRWTAAICPNGHKHVTFDLRRLYVICSDVSFRRCV
uniref:Uncharacterized protein n=1 Tax=Sinocyclocheilus grahami TaxID=75366 RepID=A0A672LXB9_SINGR